MANRGALVHVEQLGEGRLLFRATARPGARACLEVGNQIRPAREGAPRRYRVHHRNAPSAAAIAARHSPRPGLRVFSKIAPRRWLAGRVDKLLGHGSIVRILYVDGTSELAHWNASSEHVVEPPMQPNAPPGIVRAKRKLAHLSTVVSDTVGLPALSSTDTEDDEDRSGTDHRPHRQDSSVRLKDIMMEAREDTALRALFDLRRGAGVRLKCPERLACHRHY